MEERRSLMNKRKSVGDKTEPCGCHITRRCENNLLTFISLQEQWKKMRDKNKETKEGGSEGRKKNREEVSTDEGKEVEEKHERRDKDTEENKK